MNPSAIVRHVALLCLLLAGNAASATVLTLLTPDGYTLHAQAPCASSPGCQQQDGLPMALSPALLADQALLPASAIDMSPATSSFAADPAEDDVFLSLTGKQPTPSPNEQSDRNDAAGETIDDEVLQRKLMLGVRQTYTSLRALMAMPGQYLGNTRDAASPLPGRCDEDSTASAHARCAADSFAPVMSSLCVGSDGSYNSIGAANQAACPAGSIFVGNKRGAGTAEYAAYAQSLRNFAKDAASHYALHTYDERYSRNESSLRQYRHCNNCDADQAAAEPNLLVQALNWLQEPSSMLMLGLGLVALLGADALLKSRRG